MKIKAIRAVYRQGSMVLIHDINVDVERWFFEKHRQRNNGASFDNDLNYRPLPLHNEKDTPNDHHLFGLMESAGQTDFHPLQYLIAYDEVNGEKESPLMVEYQVDYEPGS